MEIAKSGKADCHKICPFDGTNSQVPEAETESTPRAHCRAKVAPKNLRRSEFFFRSS